MEQYNLKRFIDAQERDYATALAEIKNGRKRSHWMWYIFPQIAGLGVSETSKYYAITNIAEAKAYLQHPVLGRRLLAISGELLKLQASANAILGSPDDVKLQSCMTLFNAVPETDPIFEAVLNHFFNGRKDEQTLRLLAH